jgi:hypothetical protein
MTATAIFFLLGAVLGSALDHLHVASGTTSYAKPFLFQQAIWVPLLFGFAGAGFADLHRRLRTAFGAPPMSVSRPALAADLVIFVAAYWASAYLPASNLALLAGFTAAWIVRVHRGPPHRIVHGLACAACGVAAEWALTGLGAFTHHRADFLRVPLWLPGLYLLASPLLAGLDDVAATRLLTAKPPRGVPAP